jgi:hypothetical protein
MKYSLLSIFLLISSWAVSGENYKTPIELAKSQLAQSLDSFAAKEVKCKSEATVLPADDIKKIGMKTDELKDALAYFYMKAFSDCSYSEASAVIVNLQIVNQLQPETENESSAASVLIASDLAKVVKLESEFLKISNSKRDELSNISALSKPFDMSESIKALGL